MAYLNNSVIYIIQYGLSFIKNECISHDLDLEYCITHFKLLIISYVFYRYTITMLHISIIIIYIYIAVK